MTACDQLLVGIVVKIMVIGGTTVSEDDAEYASELSILNSSMDQLGGDIVMRGHDLVTCSPFPGSADLPAMQGATKRLADFPRKGPSIEIHSPRDSSIAASVEDLTKALGPHHFRSFSHLAPTGPDEKIHWEYSWLLSQLSALDDSHAVIAVGGKHFGPASLLLTLAVAKSKKILPLTFLGGAAGQMCENLRWQLDDLLDGRVGSLSQPTAIETAVELIEQLASRENRAKNTDPARFFLSYPRFRPQEADFIEITLRRRQLNVYRDESNFAAGQDLPHEISEHIERSDVFIAVWCREYACSPWCSDEFEAALERHRKGKMELWVFCVDETRMVPRAARSLITYPAFTREEIERHLLTLLERR